MERTTVYLDDHASDIVETHDINLSKAVRRLIRQEYGAVRSMEELRDELDAKLDRLLKEKQEIEQEMRQVEKRKDRLDNLLTKNDVMSQIRANDSYMAKFEEKIHIIRRAKKEGDEETEIEQYIERNAEVLADELPFSEDDLEPVIREGVRAGDAIMSRGT